MFCARYLRVEEGVGCRASPHPLTCDDVGEGGLLCSQVPVGMEDVELKSEEVCVSVSHGMSRRVHACLSRDLKNQLADPSFPCEAGCLARQTREGDRFQVLEAH